MKNSRILGAIALLSCVAANAGTYRTNTVEGLVYILTNCEATAVIELEAGDYQMPSEPTYATAEGAQEYGRSSIHLVGQTIRGLGASPADVRLVGSRPHRVVHGESGSTLENLTITGGWTDLSERTQYGYSVRAAGYYGSGVITNCIISGNSARNLGGGVLGGAVLYDCIVENNVSRDNGGGGGCDITAYSTVFRNNTAETDGGGVYEATLYDCVVTNNSALKIGGGGCRVRYATNTLFAGNSALSGGGVANAEGQLLDGYMLDGCVISNNTTTGSSIDGDVLQDGAGGGLFCQVARNCVIASNRGAIGGGTYRCLLTNCTIACNTAWAYVRVKADPDDADDCFQSGGGDYNSSLFGCTVTGNLASGDGGGVCCSDASVVVSNCVISANVCSNVAALVHGAGICVENGTVVNCTIYGNAALREDASQQHASGGGIASRIGLGRGDVRNCVLHDNYAARYGGGAYNVLLKNCVVSNNVSRGILVSGDNAYSCHLFGGKVVGTPVAFGSATGVEFCGFGPDVGLNGNPYRSDVLAVDGVYLYPNCTNCLFRDNRMSSGRVFCGEVQSLSSASLVNCTVVSNTCSYMFSNFPLAEYPMTVENCIFYGNYHSNGAQRDLFTYNCKTWALRFSHCAYGVSTLSGGAADWFDDGNYQFGVGGIPSTPGFVFSRDPGNPYALRTSSGLRGLAKVADWMDGAYDIRGDADRGKYRRLRYGKADLGCYQCWYDSLGLRLLFR